ncbi:sporulation-specific diadenylate cyclase CdaS [Paenibacillus protaetiae]|uniref:Diadenylate cyclase n=1 Tax=Paenibacillus protaetiae TaxID=2509456 RepID=A0A4P6ESS5_9BACL|nr:sporulation-specific diadenylate cyclase CdaS [Paenibacillus protaetiae]QAY65992.1 hypothetical protein ET464_05910 [Paenibacillus protaetiae]
MINLQQDCDFSPMRDQIKTSLRNIADDIGTLLTQMDSEKHCMLSTLETIQHHFSRIQSTAGTFYLNCYLSPYTSKFMELSTTLQNLSERKVGALIVVERNDPVEQLVRHGVSIGAALSHTLLESIFYPGNPLHDGAVLVKGDRIETASTVLPLSNSIVDKQKFGTRHRAALGMSELSDAIVLIVSEETGSASFAVEGHLYPVILH